MRLEPGSRLGPYEITGPLGAGGMGEVYKAVNTRLDRNVAIKILSSELADDPALRQRFEREARVISSLNHPHICVLHDVGHEDGTDYLVMELVEGESLASRLEKGALPLDQVLKIGSEVADALDKAHRRGIVHRDLKPGNMMLTPSGSKLLDFGVAKVVHAPALDPSLTAAATHTTPVTHQGSIVGTFQYMSPEQVEGKDVDARSDIFSFGSVLYEMVTGRRAFLGASRLSVASAVLEREPEPIRAIRPETPRALDRAIRVCLAKDPEDRWQTARDLHRELKWIAGAGGQADDVVPPASHRKGRERAAWIAVAALALVAMLAATGWWLASRPAPSRPLMRLSVETSPGAIFDRFVGAQVAVSPDGTRVLAAEFDPAGTWQLAVRRFDQSQFVPIAGTDNARHPFFSPDGEWIAFFSGGKLKKVPVQGGAPVTLCEAGGFALGGSWGDDGTIVAAFNEGTTGLARIPSGGGVPTPLTQIRVERGERSHVWPQVLPGSQAVLFMVYKKDRFVEGELVDADVDVLTKSGDRKTIHHGGFISRYLPSGHLVYVKKNTMWAAPFRLDRLAVIGEPQPVLEEVNGPDFDFSSTGTAVYVSSREELSTPYGIWWLDGTGRTAPLRATPGLYENVRFSPDGKRLAFEKASSWERADIWVKDLERDTESRLTQPPGRHNTPVWMPDGQTIVFDSNSQPASGLYWVRADGAGEAQRLTDQKAGYWTAGSVSPDGKWLAFSKFADDDRIQIWTAPIDGDRDRLRLGKAELFSRSSADETDPAFSPDGRWLAYTSSESGTAEQYVRPFPGPGGKWQISTGGGRNPIWSRTERKLYFLTPDWRIMVAGYSADAGQFAAAKPQLWSDKKLAYLGGCYPYDLAPDGKRFAVVLNPDTANEQARKPTDHVMVLPDFFDELRRKVPAR